jgi:hypothetical protein
MSRQRFLVLKIATALILFTSPAFPADTCFNSHKILNVDAQTIRLKALDMGWQVGKTASITAASLVMGKQAIYPKDNVEICLREEEHNLQVRVQSTSMDANQARWRDLMAKKTGKEKGDKPNL